MENYTWKDLKEAINKLSPEQLTKPVLLQREDEVIRVNELFTTEEDIYGHPDDDEYSGPLNELRDIYGDDFNESEFKIITPKGTPFLGEEF